MDIINPWHITNTSSLSLLVFWRSKNIWINLKQSFDNLIRRDVAFFDDQANIDSKVYQNVKTVKYES